MLHLNVAHARSPLVFDRITFDPKIMGGRACIRGMRITVATIVGQVADGASTDEILAAYPDLEAEDVRQALAYAAWLTKEDVIPA
jgi:uncharacterized protein (DUF433 family)